MGDLKELQKQWFHEIKQLSEPARRARLIEEIFNQQDEWQWHRSHAMRWILAENEAARIALCSRNYSNSNIKISFGATAGVEIELEGEKIIFSIDVVDAQLLIAIQAIFAGANWVV